ncbi:MAG: TetR/AcrR family transcriptional regulator [Candidatus Binataceae bacterium]
MTGGSVALARPAPAPKRERILAAGLAHFSNRPYQAVTMDRVAEAAGVAKGTLYLYFESKEALYLGIVREGLESIVTSYQATVDLNSDVNERMRRAIEASIEFYGRRRDLLRLLMTEEPRMAAARNRLVEEWRELGLKFFSSLIDEGIKQEKFTPVDSRLATLAILGGIRSVLLYYGDERPLDDLSRDLSAFLLRGVGGAPAQLQQAK